MLLLNYRVHQATVQRHVKMNQEEIQIKSSNMCFYVPQSLDLTDVYNLLFHCLICCWFYTTQIQQRNIFFSSR
jgi:hypothetical protein